MKFEYVASGLSHSRISLKAYHESPEARRLVKEKLDAIQNKNNHNISFLFNAFTEESLGRIMHECLTDTITNVFADSGGLQMITLNKKTDHNTKPKVYETQAKYSTLAMSFDEIPLVVTSDRSTFHDTKSRYFDPSLVRPKALESAQNLKNQIDYFRSTDTKTKPMMIIQGNDLSSYQEWVDIITEELGEERLPYVAGISSGAAALGQGVLEDMKRIYILSKLKFHPKLNSKFFHLLGFGSISRFLPLAAFGHFGDAFKDTLFSYDSTTHTSGINLGKYCDHAGRLVDITKYRGKEYYAVYNDVMENLDKWGHRRIPDQDFYQRLCRVASEWTALDREDDGFEIIYAYFCSSIDNFTYNLDRLMTDKKVFSTLANKKKIYYPLKELVAVRDDQDYQDWEAMFKRYIPSKGVENIANRTQSLERFFT